MNQRYSLLTVVILYLSIAIIGSLVFMGLGSQTTFTYSPYSDYNESELENEVTKSINEYRSNKGYSSLERSIFLDQGADNKSEDMANRGYFNHTNPDGKISNYQECISFSENIAKIPYKKITFSEETFISMSVNEEELADLYIKEMSKSDDHRKNLLSEWDTHGVGVKMNNKNDLYITHHMCS